VRTYKRKRPRQWRDKNKRMAAAVQMRDGGLSLREIGRKLAVDERTVRRDLDRWEGISATNVVPLVRHKTAATRPPGGNLPQQNAAPSSPVSMINRRNA